jgi:chemotaxis protein MotB
MAIQEDPPAGVPEWVVTFGDMMSLLLTFFILLFSMSEIQSQKKFQAMADSLRRQFGHETTRRTKLPGPNPAINSLMQRLGSESWEQAENLDNADERRRMQGRDRQRLWTTRAGERPTLGSVLQFAESGVELTDEAKQQLHFAAEEVRGKSNKIEVRGHATGHPPPAGAPYSDDWELAFQRCQRVVKHLVDDLGIDRRRIRISVAGRNEPVYTGVDPTLVVRNSRVEVFLLSELTPDPVIGGVPVPSRIFELKQ